MAILTKLFHDSARPTSHADNVFVAEVPALPGCVSQGRTRSEVIVNIKEAIAGYLESLQAHGEPVPPSITEEVVEVTL
jgi:antitoxin HicB